MTTITIQAMQDKGWALVDELDSVITELDSVLGEANTARYTITATEARMSFIEARTLLEVNGGNAETRKALVTLQLSDDPEHARLTADLRDAQHRLRDAERAAVVLKEKARLLRHALALAGSSVS